MKLKLLSVEKEGVPPYLANIQTSLVDCLCHHYGVPRSPELRALKKWIKKEPRSTESFARKVQNFFRSQFSPISDSDEKCIGNPHFLNKIYEVGVYIAQKELRHNGCKGGGGQFCEKEYPIKASLKDFMHWVSLPDLMSQSVAALAESYCNHLNKVKPLVPKQFFAESKQVDVPTIYKYIVVEVSDEKWEILASKKGEGDFSKVSHTGMGFGHLIVCAGEMLAMPKRCDEPQQFYWNLDSGRLKFKGVPLEKLSLENGSQNSAAAKALFDRLIGALSCSAAQFSVQHDFQTAPFLLERQDAMFQAV